MKHGALFSGIGGFNLAAQWLGWENIFDVEIDPFCQKVLAKNFPNTTKYEDIKDFTGEQYTGAIDIVSGGFPCQPFSVSGKQQGRKDERFLWGEMLRVIRTIQPRYIVAENVGGLLTIENGLVFEQVHSSLEDSGYEIQTFIIPACGVNAAHKRDRIWIVAHNSCKRLCNKKDGQKQHNNEEFNNTTHQQKWQTIQQRTSHNDTGIAKASSNANFERFKGRNNEQKPIQHFRCFERKWHEVAAEFCGMADGISDRLDGHTKRRPKTHRNDRIKALGNAIVPQVAYQIFNAIQAIDNELYQPNTP